MLHYELLIATAVGISFSRFNLGKYVFRLNTDLKDAVMGTKNKKTDKNIFDDFSSKVKDVIIELPGFNFFHSPSDVGKLDKRFIGRKNIIDRLVTILTNQETKSGAYLVTGYRGMGKTSVVNQAFAQISSTHKPLKKLTRFLKLLVFLLIIPLGLSNSKVSDNFWVVFIPVMGIWLTAFVYLIQIHWIDPKFYINPGRRRIKHLIIKIIFLEFNDKAYSRRIFFVHDLFIILSIILISFFALMIENTRPIFFINLSVIYFLLIFAYSLFYILDNAIDKKRGSFLFWFISSISFIIILLILTLRLFHFNLLFSQYLIIIYLLFVFNYVLYHFFQSFKKSKRCISISEIKNEKSWPYKVKYILMLLMSPLRHLYDHIKTSFDKYISFSRNVYININLGHDVIREIDIIRIISKSIKSKYEEFRLSFRKNMLWIAFLMGFVLLITELTFNDETFIKSTNMLKHELKSYLYVPSQNPNLLNQKNRNLSSQIINSIDKEGYNTYEYYAMCMYCIDNQVKKDTSKIDTLQLSNEINKAIIEYNFLSNVLHDPYYSINNSLKSLTLRFNTKKPQDSEEVTYEVADTSIQLISQNSFKNNSKLENINVVHENDTTSIKKSTVDFYYSFHNLPKWKKYIYKTICYIDLYLNTFNYKSQNYISVNYIDIRKHEVSLNYFFILLFISFFLFFRFIFNNLKYFGSISQKKILSKLEFLIDVIDAQVSLQSNNGVQVPLGSNGSIFKRWSKNKSYSVAGINDIEYWLIDILNDIEKLPSYIIKPEFILVFDELDKIEPKENLMPEKEGKDTDREFSSYLFSVDSSRKRQQAIYKLLSNLKYFLTTANAKFIFIAGREMYDAYLADVSDRNFFNRSIFNQVIYVKSFLTEEGDEPIANNNEFADIIGLTENYVCQFLFLPGESKGIDSLKAYNQYLMVSDEFNDNDESKSDVERLIARQKREKIIYLLHQFIIYLMHTSNGAPKKIASTFERFIYNGNMIKREISKNNSLIVSNNTNSLHLFFSKENQYMIGMISALTHPIIYHISSKIQNFEDKSLISATFLINHMFKYHNYGFSWRNLEHTPEIIEIHKTPEFREFVTSIMQFLTQTHIEEIVSGLHQFKFPKRISKEISYLSKISGESAATFNFSLDDQLLVKQYYIDQIKILEARYQGVYEQRNQNQLIHSIASLHIILGEIYFYEEDLWKAIQEFQEGTQFMRLLPVKEMSVYEFVVWIRSMLKLGLAFEKRKTNDSAFLIYGELCTAIIEYRDFDLDSLGIDIRKSRHSQSKDKHIFIKRSELNETDRKYHENIEMLTSPREYNSRDIFTEIIDNDITPIKEKILFKISTFEGIRLIYQPFLAKLQIIEKSNLGGITTEDLVRIESEFEFMNKIIRVSEKYLIETEFWNKVGDILYYKNGLIQFGINRIYNKCENKYKCDCSACINVGSEQEKDIEKVYNCEYNRRKALEHRRKIPCVSCTYYDKSLVVLLHNSINWTSHHMREILENGNEDTTTGDIIKSKYVELEKSQLNNQHAGSKENISSKRMANNLINNIIESINESERKQNQMPVDSIVELFKNWETSKDTIYIKILLNAWYFRSFTSMRKNTLKTLAGLLSNIGDVRVSCSNDQDLIRKSHLDELKKIMQKQSKKEEVEFAEANIQVGSKLEIALYYYFLSASFYKMAKEFKSYSFQLQKIVHILREYTSCPNDQKKKKRLIEINDFVNFIEDDLSKKMIKAYFGAYENIHTYMVEKFRNTFAEEQATIQSRILSDYVSIKKLPIDTELEELIFAFQHLKLKCSKTAGISDKGSQDIDDNKYRTLLFKMFEHNLASPYLVENNMFNCIIKLRFKEMLNFKILGLFDLESKNKKDDNITNTINLDLVNTFINLFIIQDDKQPEKNISHLNAFSAKIDPKGNRNELSKLNNLFELILSDSIYCLLEVIKKYHIFGEAFIFTHSYIAETHFHLMKWISYYDQYMLFIDIINNVENLNVPKKRLLDLINNKEKYNLKNTENVKKIDSFFNDIEPKLVSAFKNNMPDENQFKIHDKLNKLITPNDWQFISVLYQSERAIKEYYEAKETHNEGNAYRNLTENMYYLNDDFNDKLFHFRLAQERYRINTGRIDIRIEEAKKYGENSSLHVLENYLKTRYKKKNITEN